MKELGRGTAYNTHNITSLIRTPQACIRHLAEERSLHGGRVYAHTHKHCIVFFLVFDEIIHYRLGHRECRHNLDGSYKCFVYND